MDIYKFKEGDKVILTNPCQDSIDEGYREGDIFLVKDYSRCPDCQPLGGGAIVVFNPEELELYEEHTKRVPKVGDCIKWLVPNSPYDIYKIIRIHSNGDFDTDDDMKVYLDKEGQWRKFRDGEAPERFREVQATTQAPCPYGMAIPDRIHDIYKQRMLDHMLASAAYFGPTKEPTQPLLTIKKIMSKLEQFRANLYFSDKKMEKIGELADKLEGYASDIDDLVNNLEIVSGKLESYAEDIETAVDEDDRVAATQLIDEATEYLSKVSTLAPLASMLSNAKALDKFTDGK